MTEKKPVRASFAERVLQWFDQHGRKQLPWQQKVTAYRVWLSEIMLQQTQVSTVIPYFDTFTQRFPTVADLAAADEDDVLALWAGLGYYSRARNLHRAAKKVVADFNGEFPRTQQEMETLPGVGRSTAAAVLSLAYDLPTTIMDGNVKRVLCRYHAVEGVTSLSAVDKKLWQLAESHQPQQRAGNYTQAMMDLGATICTRSQPKCERCPVHADCQARIQGNPQDYPTKKPSKTLPVKSTLMLLLTDETGCVLLEKRPPAGIWGGLWALPEFADEQTLSHWLNTQGIRAEERARWPAFRHTFSHYHLDISPVWFVASHTGIGDAQTTWVAANDHALGVPVPTAKLLSQLAAQ